MLSARWLTSRLGSTPVHVYVTQEALPYSHAVHQSTLLLMVKILPLLETPKAYRKSGGYIYIYIPATLKWANIRPCILEHGFMAAYGSALNLRA